MWPFSRKHEHPEEAVAPAPIVAPRQDWRQVPPPTLTVQRAVARIDPGFSSSLAAWQSPQMLAPLGHLVTSDGPAGVLHDLTAHDMTATSHEADPSPAAPDTPVPTPSVQRFAAPPSVASPLVVPTPPRAPVPVFEPPSRPLDVVAPVPEPAAPSTESIPAPPVPVEVPVQRESAEPVAGTLGTEPAPPSPAEHGLGLPLSAPIPPSSPPIAAPSPPASTGSDTIPVQGRPVQRRPSDSPAPRAAGLGFPDHSGTRSAEPAPPVQRHAADEVTAAADVPADLPVQLEAETAPTVQRAEASTAPPPVEATTSSSDRDAAPHDHATNEPEVVVPTLGAYSDPDASDELTDAPFEVPGLDEWVPPVGVAGPGELASVQRSSADDAPAPSAPVADRPVEVPTLGSSPLVPPSVPNVQRHTASDGPANALVPSPPVAERPLVTRLQRLPMSTDHTAAPVAAGPTVPTLGAVSPPPSVQPTFEGASAEASPLTRSTGVASEPAPATRSIQTVLSPSVAPAPVVSAPTPTPVTELRSVAPSRSAGEPVQFERASPPVQRFGLPSMPSVPSIPSAPSLPSMPSAPSMPEMPEMPSGMPDMPSGMPEMPTDAPSAGDLAVASGLATRAPDGSVVFKRPDLPGEVGDAAAGAQDAIHSGASAVAAATGSAPAAGGGAGGVADGDIDELARRLYSRIRLHLRNELRLDHERAGSLIDIRR